MPRVALAQDSKSRVRACGGVLLVACALVACGTRNAGRSEGDLTTGQGGTQPIGSSGTAGGSTTSGPDLGPITDPAGPCAPGGPTEDRDGDRFTPAQGDCDDCNVSINPGAFDFAANQLDEDCNGTVDDAAPDCDGGLAIDDPDPVAAAKALGICRMAGADAKGWGLLAAQYVLADGSTTSLEVGPDGIPEEECAQTGLPPNPQSHGILPRFGPNVLPRQGQAMVAISSGLAREGGVIEQEEVEDDQGDTIELRVPTASEVMCTQSRTPEGFPTAAPACGIDEPGDDHAARDTIALELTIRAPTNANAFSFDFDFYTWEYSDFLCSNYNDYFVALLFSTHPEVPANRNVAFDSQGNAVSVNNGFVEVCEPFSGETNSGAVRDYPCRLGVAELAGTGFEGAGHPEYPPHAATSWLRTTAQIVPGEEFTVRFAVWDAGDEILDSTVLLDHFSWIIGTVEVGTTRPVVK